MFNNYFHNKSVSNPSFLIFFRITIGFYIMFHYIGLVSDFDFLFLNNPLITLEEQTYHGSKYFIYLEDIIHFLNTLSFSSNTAVTIVHMFYFLFVTSIILGFYSRVFALLLMILNIAIFKSANYFFDSNEMYINMSLFYLIFFPSDDYFSIRSLFQKIKKSNLTPFRRLFQIHISFAYFIMGLGKLIGKEWWNGEATWKAVNLNLNTNYFCIDFEWLSNYPLFFMAIGWFTIFIELLYPIFMNYSKTRKIWLALVIALHLGIAFSMNLYYFSAIMIIWNITNYYFEDKK